MVAGAEGKGNGEGARGAEKEDSGATGAMGSEDRAVGPGGKVSGGKATKVVGSEKETGAGRVGTETRGVAKGKGEGEGGGGRGREGRGGKKRLTGMTEGGSERVGQTEFPPG